VGAQIIGAHVSHTGLSRHLTLLKVKRKKKEPFCKNVTLIK
jgi:hypothetical protein